MRAAYFDFVPIAVAQRAALRRRVNNRRRAGAIVDRQLDAAIDELKCHELNDADGEENGRANARLHLQLELKLFVGGKFALHRIAAVVAEEDALFCELRALDDATAAHIRRLGLIGDIVEAQRAQAAAKLGAYALKIGERALNANASEKRASDERNLPARDAP